MIGRKNRDGITIRARFMLPLLAAMAAVLAVALGLAAPAQAQEATAPCGSSPLDGRTQKVVDAILSIFSTTDCSTVTSTQLAIISSLELANQNLSSLQSDDFEKLTSLEELNLFDNDLTRLPRGVFDDLTSLTHLRLYNNDLTTLPDDVFDDLTSLEHIRLNNNQLEWLPPDLFEGPPLKTLHLESNDPLACIHASQFDGLSSLTLLRLNGTQLGNINPTHFTRWGLNSLTNLRLGDTRIANSPLNFADYQAVLPALVEADTRVGDTSELTDPICPSLERLADCGGAGNPLHGRTQKVVDSVLTSFHETDCSAITVQRLELASGLTFTLRGQRLRALQEGDFDNLPCLRNLYMENNRLESLPANVFDGAPNLEQLHLDNNSLSTLPEDVFDGLASLERLRLNGNTTLETLPPGLFAGLSGLRELYLNGNSSLACIHPSQFDGLSQLQKLHLDSTGFGNIAPTHASGWGLNSLAELSFGNTSITDSALSFQDYQAVFPALVESNTRVRDPAVLSDPICGSITADTEGSGFNTFHTIVRVKLEPVRVYPNRVQASDASLLGDGHCSSDATATRHQLWAWQISDDGVTWTDMPEDRQPKDYSTRAAGECSFLYTPHTDDHGKHVRAYVSVDTAGVGANNYHSAAFGPLTIEQP